MQLARRLLHSKHGKGEMMLIGPGPNRSFLWAEAQRDRPFQTQAKVKDPALWPGLGGPGQRQVLTKYCRSKRQLKFVRPAASGS